MVGAQTSHGSGHPYVPRELNLPGFVPGFLSMSTIVGVYGGSSLLVVSLIWILSGKEYSKGDSRYAARDAAVGAVEGVTAVLEGPACLLAAYVYTFKDAFMGFLELEV